MSSSIPLRKGATCALTGLVKAWLWASGSGGNGSSSSGSGGAVLHPPTQLSEALWSFLRDQVSCQSTHPINIPINPHPINARIWPFNNYPTPLL